MYERFTDHARLTMQLAVQEARRLNHEFIGTEHILLGLLKGGSDDLATTLKNLRVDPDGVRQEVESIVQPGPSTVKPWLLFKILRRGLPYTPRAKKVVEYALDEACNLNHNSIDTGHLLLGLLREQEGVAAQVLNHLGVNANVIRAVMEFRGW